MHSLEEIIRMNNPRPKQETLVLTFHSDIGHGWLEVPRKIVESLGLDVSPYSYVDSKNYYLEGDCDAATFSYAAKDSGLKFEVVHKNFDGNHPLRRKNRVNNLNYKGFKSR